MIVWVLRIFPVSHAYPRKKTMCAKCPDRVCIHLYLYILASVYVPMYRTYLRQREPSWGTDLPPWLYQRPLYGESAVPPFKPPEQTNFRIQFALIKCLFIILNPNQSLILWSFSNHVLHFGFSVARFSLTGFCKFSAFTRLRRNFYPIHQNKIWRVQQFNNLLHTVLKIQNSKNPFPVKLQNSLEIRKFMLMGNMMDNGFRDCFKTRINSGENWWKFRNF